MNIIDAEVKVLKAMAHPVRLKIIKKLLTEGLCVCELKEDVEFSQSNLSQHLKILKEAGVLYSEKNGLRMNYFIKNINIKDVVECVENIVKEDIKSNIQML